LSRARARGDDKLVGTHELKVRVRVAEDESDTMPTADISASLSGTAASLILPMLRQTFHEDRIRFFVTSSIGFYVNSPGGVFDPDDYQNHIPGNTAKPGNPDLIRGGVYPINVIEPMLWLGRTVALARS
jgi:hypothetical protein